MLCSLSQIVLLYVFIVLSHTAGDDCQTNDHVDGCSTPLDIHLFYQTNFTASLFLYSGGLCKAGVLCPPISMDTARTRSLWRWEKKILAIPDNMADHYGKTKSHCDTVFYQNLLKVCSHSNDSLLMAGCEAAAYAYYEVANNFGDSHFVSPSPSWCIKNWVQKCIL